ncbi:MAG: choice-of-anchor Q domain-containing protein [Chloroflexota bacterium]
MITDSQFINNEATANGGGIEVRLGQAIITRTIFRQNTAFRGGGAYFENNTRTIIDSTFDNNTATDEGGGIYISSPTFGVNSIEGTTISNNTAGEGGGIWDEFSRLVITNSTLSGNSATAGDGGAIFNTDTAGGGNDQLFNVTVTGNTASGNGAAIFSDVFSATVEVYNSIISDNQDVAGNACAVGTAFGGGVITLDNNNVLGSNGNNGGCTVGTSDILLSGATSTVINTTLANNGGDTLTHALAVGSIALDSANITNCPTTDQAGVARGFDADGLLNTPAVGDCDIGAVEFSLDAGFASDPIPTSTIDLGTTVVGTQITSILEISETASGRLNVTLASITGANAGDFSVIGLDTSIANGDDPQDLAIVCQPSAAGVRTATLTLNTNDPSQPTVDYDLTCIGGASATASILGIVQVQDEDAGTFTATVELVVPAGFTDTADVDVTISDAGVGNATSGADYTAFAPTTLTFAGPLTGGTTLTQTVNITLIDDATIEGAEAFALEISNLTGAADIGQPNTHTVVINDNNAVDLAVASFVDNSAIIDEIAGTLTIDIQVIVPATFASTGDVNLTISDAGSGAATSGADYTAFAPANLTFANASLVPGTTITQQITLDILDDTIFEGVETVDLGITAISGPVELPPVVTFTAIIRDDELNVVTITLPSGETIVTVSEIVGGTTSISGDPEYITKSVDVPFAIQGDTVTYTIRARNPKATPLSQVVIYDVFDERLIDVELVSTTHGVGNFVNNTLSVSNFSLQPSEEAVIVVSARVATLNAGDVIPNAAILESPDASVHVSNLVLIGDTVATNEGDGIATLVIPAQLPNTGETPLLRTVALITTVFVTLSGLAWLGWRRFGKTA